MHNFELITFRGSKIPLRGIKAYRFPFYVILVIGSLQCLYKKVKFLVCCSWSKSESCNNTFANL